MILVDYNQMAISSAMPYMMKNSDVDLDMSVFRHLILNQLKTTISKFSDEYGEVVICCDYPYGFWRRDQFEYYKIHRKTDRDKSTINWPLLHSCMAEMKRDFDQFFPYKVIEVKGAEADDIIASICHHYGQLGIRNPGGEDILIISSDKDFQQLQKYANVDQYSTIQRKYVRTNNPERYLREHIIKGDRNDGIPNFMSDDDTFVNETKRQKKIQTRNLNMWVEMDPQTFCDDKTIETYKRNEQLINLDCVPNEIQQEVILQLNSEEQFTKRNKLLTYFVNNKLKQLISEIQEF